MRNRAIERTHSLTKRAPTRRSGRSCDSRIAGEGAPRGLAPGSCATKATTFSRHLAQYDGPVACSLELPELSERTSRNCLLIRFSKISFKAWLLDPHFPSLLAGVTLGKNPPQAGCPRTTIENTKSAFRFLLFLKGRVWAATSACRSRHMSTLRDDLAALRRALDAADAAGDADASAIAARNSSAVIEPILCAKCEMRNAKF